MAERGGFEPPIAFWTIHAFQACALNHSAISPAGDGTVANRNSIFNSKTRSWVDLRWAGAVHEPARKGARPTEMANYRKCQPLAVGPFFRQNNRDEKNKSLRFTAPIFHHRL